MKHQVNDEIRQANRKALPKFLLIMLAALIVGGVLGFCIAVFTDGEDLAGRLSAAGAWFCLNAAPWLLAALVVVTPASTLPLYRAAKKLADGWDGEDGTVSDRAERKLSVALWLSGLCLILSMFLTTAVYADFRGFIDRSGGLFLVMVGCFLAVMVEVTLIQQRIVDLTRRLNPEKKGSVYDANFQKQWLDSCDEAERAQIGRCAYKAYSAAGRTCMALWLVFTLTALALGTGVLPVLAVCVIWAVLQTTYYLEARTFLKAKAPR